MFVFRVQPESISANHLWAKLKSILQPEGSANLAPRRAQGAGRLESRQELASMKQSSSTLVVHPLRL
jgi:hypothetical protein